MPCGGPPSALLICRVSASLRDADPDRSPHLRHPSPGTLGADCSASTSAGDALYGGAKGSSGEALLYPGLFKGFDANLRAGLETGLEVGLGYRSGSENV